MWARRPMRIALAVLGLALCLGGAAAAAPPDPATWVRMAGSVYEPSVGRAIPAMIGEVFVDWKAATPEATRAAVRAQLDASVLRRIPGTSVEVLLVTSGREGDAITQLSALDEVRQAAVNCVGEWTQDPAPTLARFEPNDTLWPDQKAIHDLTRSPEAWALFLPTGAGAGAVPLVGSPEIIVAIMDSGLQVNHPDLQANVWMNVDEIPGNSIDDDSNGYVDDVNGYSFGDGTAVLTDAVGHGTGCAGIAAAVGNNATGMAGQTWRSRIMGLKLGDLPSASATLEAAKYAIDNGADIVSMSFSAGITYQAITDEFVRGFNASGVPAYGGRSRAGVMWLAAMGNGNYDTQDQTPVTCETEDNEVLGVCAVDKSGARSVWGGGQASCWSTRDGIADLSAPGGATNEEYITCAVQTTPTDPAYRRDFGGTSAATPYAAGIAALVRAASPELSAAEVNEVLRTGANADLLYEKNPTFRDNERLGKGIVDAYASVDAVTRFTAVCSVVSPSSGSHVSNTTPTVVVGAIRKGSRAPAITRVTVRIDPVEGSTPTDADAVWLDRTANTPGGTDDPDGLDDLSNETYPTDGRFSLKTPTPLSVGAAGTALHTIEVQVEDDRTPVEPVVTTSTFRVVAVGLAAGRHMLSVPYVLYSAGDVSTARPSAILAQPVGEAGDAQVARWDPTGGDPRNPGKYVRSDIDGATAPYIGVMDPGKALWVDLPEEAPRLMLQGDEVPADLWLIRDAPHGDTSTGADYLAPGWHMIGSPYAYPVALAAFLVETEDGRQLPLAAATQEGICRGVLYQYAGGTYVPSVVPNAVLEPFEGYWFRTLKRCKLFGVPDATASASTRAISATPGWALDVTARLADGQSQVTVGASSKATEAFDAGVDIEQPPTLGGTIGISIAPVSGSTDALLRDLRPDASEATWRLSVVPTKDGEATLTWGDARAVPRSFSIALTDVATGKTISVRHAADYAFTARAGERREFALSITRAGETGLGVTVLSGDTLRAVTTVTFRLSQDADVTCTVLNAAGRVVRTALGSGIAAAGTRSVTWDGHDDRGASVPAGAYRLVIEARSASGEVARGTVSVTR